MFSMTIEERIHELEPWVGKDIYIGTTYVSPTSGHLTFDKILDLYSVKADLSVTFVFEVDAIDSICPFNGAVIVILK